MPVKLWQRDSHDKYTSRVVTQWDRPLGGEEYRAQAEELDQRLDDVLDDALVRLESVKNVDANIRFKRIWCVGRAVRESGILQLPALRTERRALLWRAMAWKCWLGTRHDFKVGSDPETRWHTLRPGKQAEPKNPFRVHDLFETGFWLQQQELADAVFTFGGRVSNVRGIDLRTSINSPAMRTALNSWLKALPAEHRELAHRSSNFEKIAKNLRARWPDRGFGAARRPEHQDPEELLDEVHEVLDPLVMKITER